VNAPVCIIGAGSSGIVAAHILAQRGIEVEGFELGSDIGGIWRFRNDSGRSPAYESLQTNTSKHRTAYRSFPVSGPRDYVPNGELLEYFDAFADRFGVRERFRFHTEVTGVTGEGGSYRVTVCRRDGGAPETRSYRAVLVASGHHWDARVPEFTGSFAGRIIHSRDYRTPTDPVELSGKRVLVIGIGNSACDITCETAGVARHTFLSSRRSAHVLPKYLLGRPIDQWVTSLSSRLPVDAQASALRLLVGLTRGDQRKFGIPRPAHRLGHEHPTLSQDLPKLAADGRVDVRPDIDRLDGDTVHFVDGSSAAVDVIICATGYHVSFPWMDAALLDRVDPAGTEGREGGRIPGNRIRLYRHVVPPDCPGLFFLGLVQPLGAIPPLAEAQAEWIADLLDGTGALPDGPAMKRSIDRTEAELSRRFVTSSRHTLEVDFFPYRRLLERERRHGRARIRGRVSVAGRA
jgi:cation diffusion facilitator CzcD-associated flavoprotein CzcO